MFTRQLPAHGSSHLKRAGLRGWLLAIAFVGVAAFLILRHVPRNPPPDNPPLRPAAEVSGIHLQTADMVDLLRQSDRAIANANEALAATRRSQYWSERSLASLDDPALTARRIEMARAAILSADTKMERVREEVEILKDICERINHQ